MKYSIVIPVFGNLGWLDALLSSVETKCRRRHAEVIVANDASESQDAERLEEMCKGRRIDILAEHGSRRGFAAAVNTGVRNSSADVIFIVHTDVVLGPNTLGRLASRLKPSGGPADAVSAVCCHAPYSAYRISAEMQHRFVWGFKPSNKPACGPDDIARSLVGLYGDFDSFCRSARITRPDLVYTEDGYFFAAAVTREAWESVGEMNESLGGVADRLWVDKLCAMGGQMYVDRSTYCHHHGNATSDGPGMCRDEFEMSEVSRYEEAQREMLRGVGRLL